MAKRTRSETPQPAPTLSKKQRLETSSTPATVTTVEPTTANRLSPYFSSTKPAIQEPIVLRLPVELQVSIFKHLQSRADLISICLTNRLFYRIAQSFQTIGRNIALRRWHRDNPIYTVLKILKDTRFPGHSHLQALLQLPKAFSLRQEELSKFQLNESRAQELLWLEGIKDGFVQPYLQAQRKKTKVPRAEHRDGNENRHYELSETEMARVETGLYNILVVCKHIHRIVFTRNCKQQDEEEHERGRIIVDDVSGNPEQPGDSYQSPFRRASLVFDAKAFMEEISVDEHMHLVSVMRVVLNLEGQNDNTSAKWHPVLSYPLRRVLWGAPLGCIDLEDGLEAILYRRLTPSKDFKPGKVWRYIDEHNSADVREAMRNVCYEDRCLWDHCQDKVKALLTVTGTPEYGYNICSNPKTTDFMIVPSEKSTVLALAKGIDAAVEVEKKELVRKKTEEKNASTGGTLQAFLDNTATNDTFRYRSSTGPRPRGILHDWPPFIQVNHFQQPIELLIQAVPKLGVDFKPSREDLEAHLQVFRLSGRLPFQFQGTGKGSTLRPHQLYIRERSIDEAKQNEEYMFQQFKKWLEDYRTAEECGLDVLRVIFMSAMLAQYAYDIGIDFQFGYSSNLYGSAIEVFHQNMTELSNIVRFWQVIIERLETGELEALGPRYRIDLKNLMKCAGEVEEIASLAFGLLKEVVENANKADYILATIPFVHPFVYQAAWDITQLKAPCVEQKNRKDYGTDFIRRCTCEEHEEERFRDYADGYPNSLLQKALLKAKNLDDQPNED
ncbi:hypothetical protein BJ508DRAFT_327240 [Ascobolus immersus RN42]|uniref:F-box domain-containing protein n=1 Tax=Ascobolus immersus RN42 TaxID=1160509 RepID=A0A3N4I349_ASCIM|nr:hypothetical protein BJ508DRAFT_327240 [Ascobolus immersus RN42]